MNQSLTILVVDDEAVVLKTVTRVLQFAGYNVLSATDGQEAIQLSQSFSDAIHILLTDIMMPGLDGGQVASIIHETRPETKIVFMSGYCDHFTSPNTLFIEKPLSVPELLEAIDSVAYRSDDEPN